MPLTTSRKGLPSLSCFAAQIANRPAPTEMFLESKTKTSRSSISSAANRNVLLVPDRPEEIVTAMTCSKPSCFRFSYSSMTSAIEGVDVDGNSFGKRLYMVMGSMSTPSR